MYPAAREAFRTPMKRPSRNVQRSPRVWSIAELQKHAQRALNDFVDRRLREPESRYSAHLRERKAEHLGLLRELKAINAASPQVDLVRSLLMNDVLFNALRYVAGPPVSADDLAVLVTRSTEPLTKNRLRSNDLLPIEVFKLVCRMSDRFRFPWIAKKRKPRIHEVKAATRATAVLHAAQSLQTERRGFGREVEKRLKKRLVEIGYKPLTAPNGGKIKSPKHWPSQGHFFGECTVYERKADFLIGLSDERLAAVEAKDSSSALNSVKRVLNDTAAKAKHWKDKAGEHIVPVALLSGVFAVPNLERAQANGLYLVWVHDMDQFVSWLQAQ